MLITLAVSPVVSAFIKLGSFVVTRASGYADQTTEILVAMATGLGMLALIGGLTQFDAVGPAASPADARPDYGMNWRQSGQIQAER